MYHNIRSISINASDKKISSETIMTNASQNQRKISFIQNKDSEICDKRQKIITLFKETLKSKMPMEISPEFDEYITQILIKFINTTIILSKKMIEEEEEVKEVKEQSKEKFGWFNFQTERKNNKINIYIVNNNSTKNEIEWRMLFIFIHMIHEAAGLKVNMSNIKARSIDDITDKISDYISITSVPMSLDETDVKLISKIDILTYVEGVKANIFNNQGNIYTETNKHISFFAFCISAIEDMLNINTDSKYEINNKILSADMKKNIQTILQKITTGFSQIKTGKTNFTKVGPEPAQYVNLFGIQRLQKEELLTLSGLFDLNKPGIMNEKIFVEKPIIKPEDTSKQNEQPGTLSNGSSMVMVAGVFGAGMLGLKQLTPRQESKSSKQDDIFDDADSSASTTNTAMPTVEQESIIESKKEIIPSKSDLFDNNDESTSVDSESVDSETPPIMIDAKSLDSSTELPPREIFA